MFTYLIYPAAGKLRRLVAAITIKDNKITFYAQNELFWKNLIKKIPLIGAYLDKSFFSAKKDLMLERSEEQFVLSLAVYKRAHEKKPDKYPRLVNPTSHVSLLCSFGLLPEEEFAPFESVHSESREIALEHIHIAFDHPITRKDLKEFFGWLNLSQKIISEKKEQKILPPSVPFIDPRVMNDIIAAYEAHLEELPAIQAVTAGNSPYDKIADILQHPSTEPISPSVWEHTQCVPWLRDKNEDKYVSCIRRSSSNPNPLSKLSYSDIGVFLILLVVGLYLFRPKCERKRGAPVRDNNEQAQPRLNR